MPRQKPVPKRIVNDEPVEEKIEAKTETKIEPEDVEANGGDPAHKRVSGESPIKTESSETSEAEVDDTDIPNQSAVELKAQGLALEEMKQLDAAVEYFEWAVRKKHIELLETDKDNPNIEIHPEAAEYWLRYGDAVFSRIEATEDLFAVESSAPNNGEPDAADDDKKIAWESMDTARVCFDQVLGLPDFPKPINERIDNVVSWLDHQIGSKTIDEMDISPLWNLHGGAINEASEQTLKMVAYCRMRLGDFKMSFSAYQEAVEEFAAALQICQSYGLDYSKGLEVALPMAQCLMVLQSPTSVTVFKACLKLIRDEKKYQECTPTRLSLLNSTYEDLERQIAEYEEHKEEIQKEVNEAIQHVQGGEPESQHVSSEDEESKPVTNLGVISKRRRKDPLVGSTEASAENSVSRE